MEFANVQSQSHTKALPSVIFVGGTSGSGKSTVASALAQRLQYSMKDGDDYHSTESRAKMNAGKPLTDEDRLPWLRTLAEFAHDNETGVGPVSGKKQLVIACSALKRAYRQILVGNSSPQDCRVVMLRISKEVLAERLESRKNHFFNKCLLESQMATLELPEATTTKNVGQPESPSSESDTGQESDSEPHLLIVNGDRPVERIVDTILNSLIKSGS